MINSGTMGLPLHFGKVPRWLTDRMGDMGSAVVESVVQNYGKSEVLTRMSDPNWFQALGAVMGMQYPARDSHLADLTGIRRPCDDLLHLFITEKKLVYSRAPQIARTHTSVTPRSFVENCFFLSLTDSQLLEQGPGRCIRDLTVRADGTDEALRDDSFDR